ncbi:MAG: RdgB/HAM1 family non-canonical purine NTP pyrophosphatase [Oscillospiraceae bacterium]|nr:RdgB/HAM1 family non-canonical purine NTP pyrophosphatase [Oscillospiraceae bacterium]
MKLVLASQNQRKIREMREILSGLSVDMLLPSEAGVHIETEETGSTFAENALLKASAVMRASGKPAVADDSGLAVDALNGGPGIYTARYGGEGLSDEARWKLLLENMRGQTRRTCRFISSIVCCFPNGDTLTAEGVCEGMVAFAPQGTGGFGYDPVFYLPARRKTMAQLSPEEKNQISHRGKALRLFAEKLRSYQEMHKNA